MKPEELIGKKAYIQHKGLDIEVMVVDYVPSYGNKRYKVTPVAGKGETVVEDIIVE